LKRLSKLSGSEGEIAEGAAQKVTAIAEEAFGATFMGLEWNRVLLVLPEPVSLAQPNARASNAINLLRRSAWRKWVDSRWKPRVFSAANNVSMPHLKRLDFGQTPAAHRNLLWAFSSKRGS
jgi:hypothetical protein